MEVIVINLMTVSGQLKVKLFSNRMEISVKSNKNFVDGGKNRKSKSFDNNGNIKGV